MYEDEDMSPFMRELLNSSNEEKPSEVPKTSSERYNAWMTVSSRLRCDDSCPYVDICPMMLESSKLKDRCKLQNNLKMFNTFYNLYLGHYDGLKSEMTNVAFDIMNSCDTKEEKLAYFNALNKIMSSCYSAPKAEDKDYISEIILNISPLKK